MSVILTDPAAEGSTGEEAGIEVVDPGQAPVADPAAASEPSAEGAQQEPAAAEPVNIQDFILKGLADLDKPAEEKTDEPPPADPAAPKEEAKAEDTEEPKTEGSDDPDPKPEGTDETTDTDGKPEILTREEIDKRFPRTSKEIRDVAAANGDAALALQKELEEYGGPHFAEPMKLIAQGLQNDDNVPVISGVLAAQGVDGFTGLMKDFMTVALIETQTSEAKSDGEKYFQDACKDIADQIFKQKFGEHASVALAEKLLKYEAEGLLNTEDVDQYYGESGPDKSSGPSPVLKEKDEKIAELQRKLADQEASGAEKVKAEERQFVDQWEKTTHENSEKVLNDLFFKKSVLKVLPSDPVELKAGKEQAQLLLKEFARNFQKADPAYSKLKSSAFKGNSTTAKYQKDMQSLVDNALFETKKLAAPLEAVFSLVYSMGRNAKLPTDPKDAPEKAPNDPADPPKAPTITTQPERPVMTKDAWREHLERELSNTN